MKRAENVVSCKIDHIWMANDSMIFQFARSKGMPDGEDHVGPWHVYANPLQPNVCPFLAMAIYLFTYPELLSSNSSLFPGNHQYDRFSKSFAKLLLGFERDLAVHGVKPSDLGTHSTRKGVATSVSAGCTMSPPIVSVCIRAGWVMGGVKDRYLKYEAAGDQFVGRCAACLDLLSSHFAVSPPHWDFSVSHDGSPHTPEEEVQLQQELESFLKERLPNYDRITKATLNLARTLLASVCYHHEYLKLTLAQSSSFRASNMFRNLPDFLLKHARIAFPWTKTKYTPHFTGIPPHVILMADNERIFAELARIRAGMKEDVTELLQEREPASNILNNEIILRLDKLLEQSTRMREATRLAAGNERVEFVGVDFGDVVDKEMELSDKDATIGTHEESYAEKSLHLQRRREKEKTIVSSRVLKVGYYQNKLQVLPPDWVIPSMTAYQLVVNWLTNDFENNIPALRYLKAPDVQHLGNPAKVKLRQMRMFMKVVERLGREQDIWPNTKTIDSVNKLWEGVSPLLQKYRKDQQLRTCETGWKIILDGMSRQGEFKPVDS